ncbi:MAG: dicarboxylate/amino acid:cation symporter [Chromatiales bacterium]|nr:dicarboxylate/amino acid:cation symporter [Chromatiales bacterium]MDH3895192.1 dicarboxylate/amino acid:cation symporter [Chromatiales bacterium]MDH3932313.1 dicarboxylate/amino acid:cation symporter [Chromatiales bacterium]MDH4014968.1 dicarboxylate/amino acid:cation symporter [Chromatiales bacterium]PLX55037.1 MAG: dicarboxylate/amino acid:cation symporter [Chromatiales bacterium]
MFRLKLHWQILIAIVLAAIAGHLVGQDSGFLGVAFYDVFDFVGTLFINALKMLIVPLIASSIIVGVAGIGSSGDLGRLGGKTLLFYAITTLSAILVGLVLVNTVQPGLVNGEPAQDLLALSADADTVAAKVGEKGAGDVVEIFLRMVPPNIIEAAANGEMLGLIFFSILFGFFMTRLGHETADPLFRFWDAVFHVMMRMTEWVMLFAPIGVFGLVARTVAKTGFDAAAPLIVFALTVLGALLFHAAVTLPAMLRIVAKVSPLALYRAISPALLTAFSTASSSATLPITIDCVEKKAGVPNRISSFVLPLGATVNMNGTALYECVAAMFIAQAYGLELSFGVQFSIVVIALVTSIGVAGIPSASLVAIAIILSAVGLPVEAIGVLFVFDRVLDMARTSINVLGDACCAVIVARLEGEEGILTGEPAEEAVRS